MPLKNFDPYSLIWRSSDELRGGMDAGQYKDFVLSTLFIKCASDEYGDANDFAPPVTIPCRVSCKDVVALKGKSDTMKMVELRVPSWCREQTATIEVLRKIAEKITALRTELTNARQVMQGTMQEFLNGEIRMV